MTAPRPLKKITRETLEPLWMRHDIPTSRIAKALGVTRQGLSYKAKSLGLPSRAGNQVSNQKMSDDVFSRMWMAGVSTADMARHFGYSGPSAVARRRVLLGLPKRTRGANRNGIRGSWRETITLAQFFEMELADRMKRHGV